MFNPADLLFIKTRGRHEMLTSFEQQNIVTAGTIQHPSNADGNTGTDQRGQ